MSQHHPHITEPTLFSMHTQAAEIQIVASSRGIVLDLQATNIDTEGHARASHAITKLCLDEAMGLAALLENAISAAWDIDDPMTERTDPRQTALWSPATFTAPCRTSRRAA